VAGFGLDKAIVDKLSTDLNVDHVRLDQAKDFFFLPQLNAIYEKSGDSLKKLVCSKLKAGTYAPRPPIEMEVPKRRRVRSDAASIIGPNYFRPGSVLYPEDRMVYHYIGQVAADLSKTQLEWEVVFSNKPLAQSGAGFEPSNTQWAALKSAFESTIQNGDFAIVLRCDLAQYFFSINQHDLVNQLEHQGMSSELKSFAEKFLLSLTLDKSSRGILQGCYGSDVLGNSFLSGIDEYIKDNSIKHFRYVDDFYILFDSSDDLRRFFPSFVKKLRDYDLNLNEAKSYISQPTKVLKEETELDKAIDEAKAEAAELLTTYEVVEVESGPYGEDTIEELVETAPEEEEVELEATRNVFGKLDDFKGDERDRAEAFCLSLFRKANDPFAVDYVISRWQRQPHKANEYALYLNRFIGDETQRQKMDSFFAGALDEMLDFQAAWAATVIRRMPKISPELLSIVVQRQRQQGVNDVVRSLLTYAVARHGSAARRKELRDGYANNPLLVQLATIHASEFFVAAERNAFLGVAAAHGDLHSLLCEAVKK
jgi:ribosomal protein L9